MKTKQLPRMKNIIVYGDFTEPLKGVNFIVIRLPEGRVPWSKKIAPAITKLVRPWFPKNDKHRYWYIDGEYEGQDLWKTKVATRYLWVEEKLFPVAEKEYLT